MRGGKTRRGEGGRNARKQACSPKVRDLISLVSRFTLTSDRQIKLNDTRGVVKGQRRSTNRDGYARRGRPMTFPRRCRSREDALTSAEMLTRARQYFSCRC